jgi:DNA-binding MarR family transcriptional regulator
MPDERKNAGAFPEVNRLVHEPTRYNIMALLYVVKKAEFLFVQNQIGLTPGNLSAHVSKLEAAGYMVVDKKFVGKMPRTMLSLTKAGRKAFEDYRRTMKDLFTTPLENRTDPD